jgi:hypothetical protein
MDELGTTIVVGAPGESSCQAGVVVGPAPRIPENCFLSSSGAAYVYHRNNHSTIGWHHSYYLKPNNPQQHAQFGFSVALEGDIVAVGAPGESNSQSWPSREGPESNDALLYGAGATYVFEEGGRFQTAYLKASNTNTGHRFGSTIAISGGRIVTGALHENVNHARTGAVYTVVKSSLGWEQEDYFPSPQNGHLHRLVMSGDTLAIIESGILRIYSLQ